MASLAFQCLAAGPATGSAAGSAARPVRGPAAPHYADWQAALADAVRDPAELCRLLDLPPSLSQYAVAEAAKPAAERFSMLVPRPYLARIRPGDPKDPLLVQVLPTEAERVETPGFTADPLGEARAMVGPGLLSKYRGRLLILTTGHCAVHCRFCFRRHFPALSDSFGGLPQRADDWEATLARIAADRSIHEVILSGGDPLTLPDERLARLAGRLAQIPHLRRLRVHTRLPIMIPQRINGELLQWLRGTRLTVVMVVHVNHPAEIDGPVADALARLVDAGVPVLNQAVLLRGVNDRLEVLVELCERLIDLRVMPYYLHHLDQVAGAAHFNVPEHVGRKLIAGVRNCLPGYAVPTYVRELADGGKQPM